MYNDLFSIGPVTVHGYGLMIAIGIIAAFAVAEKRAPGCGLDPDVVFDQGIWATVGGLLGAKIMYWITILPEIFRDPKILLDFGNGMVVYGGILLGIFAGWLFCRRKKLKFLAYFDLIMPSIALAQGFGRLGCFLAGCCYGIETDSPLGITFTHSDYAPNGVSLVPTQLISAAFDFLNFAVLAVWAKKGKKTDGQVAAFYLVNYSFGRFLIEFLRGDAERGSVGPFSTSQFIAIFTFAAGLALLIGLGMYQRKHGKTAAETASGAEESAETKEEEISEASEEAPAASDETVK